MPFINSDVEAELMECERILSMDGILNMYTDGLISRMNLISPS